MSLRKDQQVIVFKSVLRDYLNGVRPVNVKLGRVSRQLIGHITEDDLAEYLTDEFLGTNAANSFLDYCNEVGLCIQTDTRLAAGEGGDSDGEAKKQGRDKGGDPQEPTAPTGDGDVEGGPSTKDAGVQFAAMASAVSATAKSASEEGQEGEG